MYEISQREYESRRERVRKELERRDLDVLVLFSPLRVFYLTGYHLLSTERPVAMIFPVDGEPIFYVPKLEEEHLKYRVPWVRKLYTYFDYPGVEHPMKQFLKIFEEEKLSEKRIGADSNGYLGKYGYKGPTLSEVIGRKVSLVPDIIDEMRLVKSEGEIELLKESAKWCTLALRYLQEYSLPGTSETEACLLASVDASSAVIRALGPATFAWVPPAKAYFRGQVGEFSYYPHMMYNNVTIKKGDVLIGEASAYVGGYSAELERTMIVGEPSEDQRKHFKIMMKAREEALKEYKPGNPCCAPNKAAFKVFREEGVLDMVFHRTGHGIGLEGHEPPWIEDGDTTELKPGMVFSCEPGLYVPRLGGFRHSDTVIITEDGADVITNYPTEVEELIIR
ncbi:MAG TPA: aminopeptidase P family protein [Candidatus Korarchaeota archaeon]|nr:aminopeptidase P family protein [Candidatus Korarchaeota archaeon]